MKRLLGSRYARSIAAISIVAASLIAGSTEPIAQATGDIFADSAEARTAAWEAEEDNGVPGQETTDQGTDPDPTSGGDPSDETTDPEDSVETGGTDPVEVEGDGKSPVTQPPAPPATPAPAPMKQGDCGAVSAKGWSSPIAPGTYKMSSNFSEPRSYKINGSILKTTHASQDLTTKGKSGIKICAAGAGKVIAVVTQTKNPSCGKYVKIQHSSNLFTMYCHGSSLKVKEGQQVKAGQLIMLSGNTGTHVPHLHFEISKTKSMGVSTRKGNRYDPVTFLRDRGITLKGS